MRTPDRLAPAYTAAHRWLTTHRRLLIVTHQRPDGDAVGSVLALAAALPALGGAGRIHLDLKQFPAQLQPFVPATATVTDPWTAFDGLVCLDCANAERLALPGDTALAAVPLPVLTLDHHVSNTRYGEVVLVDDTAAATAEILANLLLAFAPALPADAATFLLLGLTQDTGCFRFNNTTAGTFDAAAALCRAGGDYRRVMDELYFSVPHEVHRLHARVIEATRFAFGGRLAYFFITDELLAQCGATVAQAEDLVDLVRTIAGVEVTCRLQQLGPDIRFSFRSRRARYPVLALAQRLDGGGHLLAAGATLKNSTPAAGEQRLLELARELFHD